MTKEELKIVFFGTPDFAVESLRRLVEGKYNIVGVVTMPDKPAGRGHHLLQSDVKKYAQEHSLRHRLQNAAASGVADASTWHIQPARFAATQVPWGSTHQLGRDEW